MKNYMMVTQEALLKLAESFSGAEEVETFMEHIACLTEEMHFTQLMMKRVDADSATNLFLKQLCILTIFCREHMDLIHEMIRKLECRPMTDEEIKNLKG